MADSRGFLARLFGFGQSPGYTDQFYGRVRRLRAENLALAEKKFYLPSTEISGCLDGGTTSSSWGMRKTASLPALLVGPDYPSGAKLYRGTIEVVACENVQEYLLSEGVEVFSAQVHPGAHSFEATIVIGFELFSEFGAALRENRVVELEPHGAYGRKRPWWPTKHPELWSDRWIAPRLSARPLGNLPRGVAEMAGRAAHENIRGLLRYELSRFDFDS
jgi:hypothetical protein